MTRRRILHVDAFTSTPLEGNPAAVVIDAQGLDGAVMQRIALNQKLSETVFLLPPNDPANDARVGTFTPLAELPFAGHPIVAVAHTLVSERIAPVRPGQPLRLETGAGVIPVEVSADGDSPMYTMTQATPEFRAWNVAPGDVARWVGLSADDVVRVEQISTGTWWPIAQLASLDAMMRVQPNMAGLYESPLGVFCIGAEAADADVHVRFFAPGLGVPEDPVTGSANGCIAAIVAKYGLLPSRNNEIRYVAEQGREMGQPGRVYLRVTTSGGEMSVRVGGQAVTALSGELLLPD